MADTHAREAFKGFIVGFLCAEKPAELNTLELEQHLAALVWVASSQANQASPLIEETALVLESGITQLVKKKEGSCTCFRCRIEDLGKQTNDENDGIKASVILFVGRPSFLHESATQVLYGRIAAEGYSQADVHRLLQLVAGAQLPGEIFYVNTANKECSFQQTHMMTMMMHYLHHGRQFDGDEAAIATLRPVQMLSPTWP